LFADKGSDGVAGAQGADGAAGSNARGVNLTATAQVVNYNVAGTTPAPATTTITATPTNTTGTVFYEYFVNDVSVRNNSTASYVYTPPANHSTTPAKIEVQIREGATTGPVLARDQISIYFTRTGLDAITVVLSNEAHSVPTDSFGTATSYAGSGTTIRAWIGSTPLTYAASGANTFSVSTTQSGITPNASPTTTTTTVTNDTRTYGNASDMQSDTASITFAVTVRNAASVATTVTKVQTFSKSRQGIQGLPGADGADGAAGLSSRGVNLTATAQVINYNVAGTTPSPATATITATPLNTVGTVFYQYFVNDISVQNTSTASYVYTPPANHSTTPAKIEVQIREGASTGPILARDQLSVYFTRTGLDAITVVLSNEAHTVPADSAGTVTSYAGSGTTIRAWIGSTALAYATSGANTFSVATSQSGITPATPTTTTTTVTNDTRTYGNASAMTADTASITYTVTVRNAASVATSVTKVQTFSKSRDGSAGSAGFNAATLYAYKRAASAPTDNPGAVTYTFATADWTPLNGWSKTVPTGTNPVWAVVASAYANTATDAIAAGEWSSPVQVFANGTDGTSGLNVATVFIYQRTSTETAPTLPSATTTYTFATGGLTGLNNGWTSSAPLYAPPNEYLWISTATASATGTTDTIGAAEWAAVRLLSVNGEDGADSMTVSLSNPTATIACNSSGVPKAGAFNNANGTITVYSGATDVTALSTFSRTVSNVTGTVNTALNTPVTGPRGYYEITGISADSGYMEFTVTYGSNTSIVRFSVSKARDGAPASSVTDGTINNVTVTTYPATGQGGPMDLAVGPGGTITVSFFGGYRPSSEATTTAVQAKAQYREKNVGAPWTDFPNSQTQGNLSYYGTIDQETGEVGWIDGVMSFNRTLAGPTSLKLYEFQFVARRSSGSSTSATWQPGALFTVQWS
jgi:hypothetical protein